jgi:hypothetical protein
MDPVDNCVKERCHSAFCVAKWRKLFHGCFSRRGWCIILRCAAGDDFAVSNGKINWCEIIYINDYYQFSNQVSGMGHDNFFEVQKAQAIFNSNENLSVK